MNTNIWLGLELLTNSIFCDNANYSTYKAFRIMAYWRYSINYKTLDEDWVANFIMLCMFPGLYLNKMETFKFHLQKEEQGEQIFYFFISLVFLNLSRIIIQILIPFPNHPCFNLLHIMSPDIQIVSLDFISISLPFTRCFLKKISNLLSLHFHTIFNVSFFLSQFLHI